MRIVELSLRNYRVFEEVDLELPARVIGIFGVNGAGKSALVESIQYGLYGRARTAKDQIRTQGILTDCVVRMAFEHGGNGYEVRRTISGKNHKTDAELFVGGMQLATGVTEVDSEIRRLLRMDQQVFRASVFAEQKQLDAFSDVTKAKRQEMVLRLLGIKPVDEARTGARRESRETKGSAERLAGSVQDVAEHEARLGEARNVARQAKEALTGAAEALKEAEKRAKDSDRAFRAADKIRERVDQIALLRTSALEQLAGSERRRREVQERIEALDEGLEALEGMERELAGLSGAPERLEAARELALAVEEVRNLEAELADLPQLDAERALAELEASEAEFREADQRQARADLASERAQDQFHQADLTLQRAGDLDPGQPCPTCGQPLGEGFDGYLKHCREELARLHGEAKAAASEVRAARTGRAKGEARLAKAKAAGELTAKAADRRGGLLERVELVRQRLVALAEPFDGRIPDVDAVRAEAARAKALELEIAGMRRDAKQLAQLHADLKKVVVEFDACQARASDLELEEARLAFDVEEHARVKKEAVQAALELEQWRTEERAATETVAEIEREVSRLEGIVQQAMEVAARVGAMRDEARYLERVAVLLDGFRDHLVARIGPELSREAEALFRDLTNREYEDLKVNEDDLSIEISDGGRYFSVERFSGSEGDLANLALRVAISMHLSRVSGADIGMMVLDEVLGSLDQERKDLMIQAMGKLSARFHQLFVITHAEQVKDQFAAGIQVTKVGRRRSQAALV